MTYGRQGLVFTADFQCVGCTTELHVVTFLAVVRGPGYEYECPKCHQGYLVKHNGAIPITERFHKRFIDAVGEPFTPPKLRFPTPPEERQT